MGLADRAMNALVALLGVRPPPPLDDGSLPDEIKREADELHQRARVLAQLADLQARRRHDG